MIVVGIDPHKAEHTAVAVDGVSGATLAWLRVESTPQGHARLCGWLAGFERPVRVGLEDVRHVSRRLEVALLGAGVEVVRVPPRLMAAERRGARRPGKSDAIDATAVARAVLREPRLAPARLDRGEREVELLVAHRDRLVGQRTADIQRLRWQLHELGLEAGVAPRTLHRACVRDRLRQRLLAGEPSLVRELCCELLVDIDRQTRRIDQLERELGRRMRARAGALLQIEGCAGLTASVIVAEVGDPARFKTEAQLAAAAGIAPLDASSGRQQRHRLNRGGNRKLNCAIHRIAITQARLSPSAQAYLARKQAEGKTRREALRCLKRRIVRRVWHALQRMSPSEATGVHPTNLT